MTRSDSIALKNEAMRTRINLIKNMLDVIELCLNDHSSLAAAVVQMTVDNVVVLAEEIQESIDQG